jgi:hypothetical protein
MIDYVKEVEIGRTMFEESWKNKVTINYTVGIESGILPAKKRESLKATTEWGFEVGESDALHCREMSEELVGTQVHARPVLGSEVPNEAETEHRHRFASRTESNTDSTRGANWL